MKLAIVYNQKERKLQDCSYAYVYRGMLDAVIRKFSIDSKIQYISFDCHYLDIDADVILFFDVHSSHHIQIVGIEKHPALKIEYMSDPHQKELKGVYRQTGQHVHKLSAEQRIKRAAERGIHYIICPVKEQYYKWLAPHIKNYCSHSADDMLLWFPVAPCFQANATPLIERKQEVLGNGATWAGDLDCYAFRKWAFGHDFISVVPHFIENSNTPSGAYYGLLLSQYAGALALDGWNPVAKYFEMPLAGCLTFVQPHAEYEELGFKGGINCIYVDKDNFKKAVTSFLENIEEYQLIADAGRLLVANNYTADHFAEFIYEKCNEEVKRGSD